MVPSVYWPYATFSSVLVFTVYCVIRIQLGQSEGTDVGIDVCDGPETLVRNRRADVTVN